MELSSAFFQLLLLLLIFPFGFLAWFITKKVVELYLKKTGQTYTNVPFEFLGCLLFAIFLFLFGIFFL